MTEGEKSTGIHSQGRNRRLIVAALIPLAACGLQFFFWTAIQPYVWFLFYPAVFFSSWVGGLRGGLAATVLSSGLVLYFFIPPQFSFAVQRPMSLVSIAMFTGMGVLFSYFHERLRKANQQAADALAAVNAARDQLEERVSERTVELTQALTSLQQSEQAFRTLADALPQIVWITRPDGWNIYFNQQWMDYTGQTLEESFGHGWNKSFHPDDQQRAGDAWQQAMATDGAYALECRLRRADGAYRWWLIRGVPVHDAEGKILKWFGTCTDIENLKQAEASLRQSNRALRMISQCNQELVHATDETELLQAICRITVEQGGYRMAWVGFAEQNAAKSVRPVAQAGVEAGYLDTVNIPGPTPSAGAGQPARPSAPASPSSPATFPPTRPMVRGGRRRSSAAMPRRPRCH